MRVNESWQSRIFTAGILNFIVKKLKLDECSNYVFTPKSYIILLEEHSSTTKQDRVTANSHHRLIRPLIQSIQSCQINIKSRNNLNLNEYS